ncbi:MAG: hypothetical protein RML72_11750 [Bacteroidia bacterium]|nr:hypothetical protein [Bacteroidia bacterium]MDW8159531.1 hypothetical protein [Bacteroidia bacterium]
MKSVLIISSFLAFFITKNYAQDNSKPHSLLKVYLKDIEKISQQQRELLNLKNAKIINYLTKDKAYLIAIHASSPEELVSLRRKVESIFGPSAVNEFQLPDVAQLEALPTLTEKKSN